MRNRDTKAGPVPGPGQPRQGWMTFVDSGPLNVERLTPDQIDIRDICRGLAVINRFLGQTRRPIPVLWHSLMVSGMLSGQTERTILEGLFHDAGEVYVGDWVRPIKHLLGPGLEDLEAKVQETVFEAAGLPGASAGLTEPVRLADDVMTRWEVQSPWGSASRVQWYIELTDHERLLVEQALETVGPPPTERGQLEELKRQFFRQGGTPAAGRRTPPPERRGDPAAPLKAGSRPVLKRVSADAGR